MVKNNCIYWFLGNILTANIRRCIFGQPDDHVMLIEAVDLAYNVRFDIDGVRLLNGSAFSWASVGKRYNVTFKTLQTTVGIAPSKGPIGPLEVHAYISHKVNNNISTDGILSKLFVSLFVCSMMFNTIFNNISVYWRWKPEDPEKTSDLLQVTDKLYHIILYTSPWSRFELTTSVVIGTDCIGSCKSNYHTITTTTVPLLSK